MRGERVSAVRRGTVQLCRGEKAFDRHYGWILSPGTGVVNKGMRGGKSPFAIAAHRTETGPDGASGPVMDPGMCLLSLSEWILSGLP